MQTVQEHLPDGALQDDGAWDRSKVYPLHEMECWRCINMEASGQVCSNSSWHWRLLFVLHRLQHAGDSAAALFTVQI